MSGGGSASSASARHMQEGDTLELYVGGTEHPELADDRNDSDILTEGEVQAAVCAPASLLPVP